MAEPHLIAGDVGVGFPVPDRGHAEEKIGWIRAGSDDVQPIPCSLLSWSSGGRWSTFRWGGTEWSGFESLGMPVSARTGARIPLTGFSMACAWDGDHLDVFARGMDGNLHAVSLEIQQPGPTGPPSRIR